MADDARLGSVTAPVTSDTFTFAGACETRSNNWLIHVESPALFASPARRQAVDDSRPWDTACLGSPKRDAMSPILRESKVLKSELKMELGIITDLSFPCGHYPRGRILV